MTLEKDIKSQDIITVSINGVGILLKFLPTILGAFDEITDVLYITT